MADQYSRTRLLLGEDGLTKLRNARVAVFGLGGVGGYAAEALARSGIGQIDLIDDDTVNLTNLNRQILALHSTVGMSKVEAAKKRILDIDPSIVVTTYETFYLPETAGQFDFSRYDYVLDAIDTVTGKLALVQAANAAGVPIISSMGTGNKLDPTAFRIGDIYETSVCPLARIMRKECRRRGIDSLKVLYSLEEPISPEIAPDDPVLNEMPEGRNALPGSNAFGPSVAGLIIAGEVIKDLIGK